LQSISNNEYVIRTLRKEPAHIAEAPSVAITSWFTVRGLKEYAEQMLAFGFYDLAALKTATQLDFEAVGIDDPNTRALLIAAFAQAETLFEEHPNPFVCTGRKIERGAVTWSVATFDCPKSLPDVVTMSSLSYSVETTRTKLIIRAIATYEDYMRRTAPAEEVKPASPVAPVPSESSTASASSPSSEMTSPVVTVVADPPVVVASNTSTSGFTKPAAVVVPTQDFGSNSFHRSPRTLISPRRLNRTTTENRLVPEPDNANDRSKSSSKHRHRHHRRDVQGNTVPCIQVEKEDDEKIVPIREQKNHGASIAVISPPPRKTEPCQERKASFDQRASLATSMAGPKKDMDSCSSDSSGDSDGNSGTLESFLMTLLKKSSTHSSTVRGQAKLLFKEGVFTLDDLDELLLDLTSPRWLRLCDCLDKRVVLACTTRAKVIASKSVTSSP